MVLETPLLKVSRPVAACSRCRAAKIKCDGKLPACSACEKTGKSAECASANDTFARGKERSYVSTLETRIEKLERRLHEAQRRKSSTLSLGDLTNTASPNVDASDDVATKDHKMSGVRAAKRKEARDIDEIVSDFGYLTVNATARDYRGFDSFMSYAKLILSACIKDRLPAGHFTALPPRQQMTIMMQHYAERMLSLLPFIDETALYFSVDAVYNALSDHKPQATAFDHWTVRMVLAVMNGYMSEYRGDQYNINATGHVSAALAMSEEVLQPGAISSVQALLFLAEYALVDPQHFDAWSLIGAASRTMVDIGLHADPPKDARIPRSKLELRRKVFYSVYMLDRSAAIIQSRSYSFSDASFHVINPFQSNQGPQTPQAATSPPAEWRHKYERARDFLGLRQIQSRWYYDLFQSGREPWSTPYQYIWRAYHDMANWFAEISSNTSSTLRAIFELEVLYSYVYILGPSSRVPRPHPYAQTLLFEHCIAYATLLTRTITDPTQRAPVTFDDNMKAYMTGMQLLDVLVKSRDQLLSGIIPEPPQPSAGTLAAPALPIPQGEPNSNLMRAIAAIKQIGEALKRFGQRWGFRSWRDDYEAAVKPMLDALNSRMWELSQTPVDRRPPVYPHPSARSGSSIETVHHVSTSPGHDHAYAHLQHQQQHQHQHLHQQQQGPTHPSQLAGHSVVSYNTLHPPSASANLPYPSPATTPTAPMQQGQAMPPHYGTPVTIEHGMHQYNMPSWSNDSSGHATNAGRPRSTDYPTRNA